MVITQYELNEQNVARATVELSHEEFDKALNAVYLKNRYSINVPGFRKGKAPRKMMEKIYGEGLFYEDALNDTIPEIMRFITEEKELKPIAQAWVDNADRNDDTGLVQVTMNIPNYPVIELEPYAGLSAVRKTAVVTDAEIDARIDEVRARNSSLVPCDRAANLGDTVVIDYVGYIDGQPFAGGKAEGSSLELGSHQFIDTYEAQLVGSRAGDDVEVHVKFPFDYHSENLRDKDATFKVHVHEVKEQLRPELDDEFAKDVSEFETLAEYRDSIRAELLERKENVVRDEFYGLIMEQIVDSAKLELHDSVIDEQTQNMLAQQGAS
ncbi:MAG: trigger factor, partial [Oscillospiraceae bacterium]|nr:trigger factor [Oscillospiraceae bacterium]